MKDIRMRNRNQIKDKTYFLSKWKSFGWAAPPLLQRLLRHKTKRAERENEQQDDAIDLAQQGGEWMIEQAISSIRVQKQSIIQILKGKLQETQSGIDRCEHNAERPQERVSYEQPRNSRTDEMKEITINNYGKVNIEKHANKNREAPPLKEKPKGRTDVIKTKQSIEQRRAATTTKRSRSRMTDKVVPGQKKTSVGIAAALKCTGKTIVKTGESLFCALTGIGGGCVLIMVLCVVLLFAAVLASPMGILYADQVKEPGTILLNMAIAQINTEYTAEMERLQEGEYGDIEIHGAPPDWREVVAVFASKTAGGDDGVDVLLLDADKVERLRKVFWDMTSLRAEEEEGVLHIYIEAKSADDMRMVYIFSRYQNQALDLLLEELDSISSVMGDLTISQEDAIKLLEDLPEDLDPLRKAVIEHALSLVGKVNYFWGGKSLVLGWDPRWGTTMQVTSEGSTTTGTYRPFGLDCSGFVDWAFYNATDGEYVLGHGGGTVMQREYCEEISWSEALPGDLVFYADDSHVGIVGGWDEQGNMLVIHCSGSHNNVVITDADGFGVILRPWLLDN